MGIGGEQVEAGLVVEPLLSHILARGEKASFPSSLAVEESDSVEVQPLV